MRNTTIALMAPAAITATTTAAAVDVSALHGLADVILNTGVTGGADEVADVKLTHCATSGGTYTDVANGAFAQVTYAGGASCQTLVVDADSLKKYVKVVATLDGTTPAVTLGVTISAKRNYA